MKKVYGHQAHNPHKKLFDQVNQYDNPTYKKETEEVDAALDAMAELMDQDAAEIGMTIADLFRTLTVAYLTMPVLEFHSDMICVARGEDGITVTVRRPEDDSLPEDDSDDSDEFDDFCDGDCAGCPGCDDLDDDYDIDYDDDDFDEEDEDHED